MTAASMGAFGTYKHAYNQFKNELQQPISSADPWQTVWVTKRYVPTDLRTTAPVPRYKPVVPDAKSLAKPNDQWVPPVELDPRTFSRDHEEREVLPSQPSTRCEQWSTLRQILPSRGRADRDRPPNWGTGTSLPPLMTSTQQRRFGYVNSPMTRYVDEMHINHRLFKLY